MKLNLKLKTDTLIFKCLILCTAIYAILMMLHWPIGFTFFTQLSNIYLLLVVILQSADQMTGRRNAACTRFLLKLKFSACVSIFITFFIYLCVIAPLRTGGFINAYLEDHGASLCMHLLDPAFALLDYYLVDVKNVEKEPEVFYGIIPPVLYMAFIYILGQMGVRWYSEDTMLAPYPFLNYAAPAGWFGFRPETISFTTLGIGVFYCLLLLTGLFFLVTYGMKRFVRKINSGKPD